MISTIVVLYLSLVTETKKDIDVNLYALSKYGNYNECRSHRNLLEKKGAKQYYNVPEGKRLMYFCSIIKYDSNFPDIHSYVPKIPYCNKEKKGKYFCGYPI